MNILLVDDNYDLVDGLSMILESEGHKVSLANSGKEAIGIIDSKKLDMAFIDIKMPDVNGLEIFLYLHEQNPEVAVYMMTGFRVEQVLSEIVINGKVAVLRTPFSMEELTQHVQEIGEEGIILIDSDDPHLGQRIEKECIADGHAVSLIMRSQNDLVAQLQEQSPSILIVDMGQPLICSLAIYLELKHRGRTCRMLALINRNSTESETSDPLRSIALTGCLFKPFNPEALLAIVNQKQNQ